MWTQSTVRFSRGGHILEWFPGRRTHPDTTNQRFQVGPDTLYQKPLRVVHKHKVHLKTNKIRRCPWLEHRQSAARGGWARLGLVGMFEFPIVLLCCLSMVGLCSSMLVAGRKPLPVQRRRLRGSTLWGVRSPTSPSRNCSSKGNLCLCFRSSLL